MDKDKWKKIILIGITATVVPGGFIILSAVGLNKLYTKLKRK